MVGCASCVSKAGSSEAVADPRLRQALWVALFLNATMFGVEAVAALYGRSVALQADAVDFFSDAANYGISLFVLGMGVQARARAALFKGVTMGLFGVGVLGTSLYRTWFQEVPDAQVMGIISVLALVTNLAVAGLLYRYRGGDSNIRSVWLCSRNDALANLAVIAAASGVLATGTGWPDLLVAAGIATLCLSAAVQVIGQARTELRYLPSRAGHTHQAGPETRLVTRQP